VGVSTVRYIGDERVEEERPAQRVKQSFFQLVKLEVLVSDSLGVDSNTLNSQDAIFLAQPTAVELIVRYDPEEENTNAGSQESSYQENNLPGLDGGSRLTTPDSNAVSDTPAENLSPPVEAEPDTSARTLLFLCVPLRREERETRCNG
jgi:hypothetical protein